MIILETRRLIFREHELADLEPFCEMEADPDVRRYVGGLPRTPEAAEAKFRAVHLRPVKDRMALWATVFKADSRYIGYCGVYPHFGPAGPIPGEGSLGFYLARPYWNQGLATEAGRALVDFGFQELALERIIATVEDGNEASIHVLQKLKFLWRRFEPGQTRSFHHYELLHPSTQPA